MPVEIKDSNIIPDYIPLHEEDGMNEWRDNETKPSRALWCCRS